ncbi:MAG: hypothetical protein ACO1N9_04030 [Flavobacterium sp.]
MKINPFPALIAILLSALIAFGFYSFTDNSEKVLLTVGGFIFSAVSLLLFVGTRFGHYTRNVNVRHTSAMFFAAFMMSNIAFCFMAFEPATYIIINGILFLIFILIIYYLLRPAI